MSKPMSPFDLHVLGMPPAFVLSQDQTLRLIETSQASKAISQPKTSLPTGLVLSLRVISTKNARDKTAPQSAAAHASLPTYKHCQRAPERLAVACNHPNPSRHVRRGHSRGGACRI